jgi:ABC-2 type transport system permease protein
VTSIVEAIRALLSNQPAGSETRVALACWLEITPVAYILAMKTDKKQV